MKTKVEVKKTVRDDIISFSKELLDDFYLEYLDYICNTVNDIQYEINDFLKDADKYETKYKTNFFYPLYKYIKKIEKIEEDFMSWKEIILLVDNFFHEKKFRGFKISLEDLENKDYDIDYQLEKWHKNCIIEYLFEDSKYNFKIRRYYRDIYFCKVTETPMPFRFEIIFREVNMLFKKKSAEELIDIINKSRITASPKNIFHRTFQDIDKYIKYFKDLIDYSLISINIDYNKLDLSSTMQEDIGIKRPITFNFYIEEYSSNPYKKKIEIETFRTLLDKMRKGDKFTYTKGSRIEQGVPTFADFDDVYTKLEKLLDKLFDYDMKYTIRDAYSDIKLYGIKTMPKYYTIDVDLLIAELKPPFIPLFTKETNPLFEFCKENNLRPDYKLSEVNLFMDISEINSFFSKNRNIKFIIKLDNIKIKIFYYPKKDYIDIKFKNGEGNRENLSRLKLLYEILKDKKQGFLKEKVEDLIFENK